MVGFTSNPQLLTYGGCYDAGVQMMNGDDVGCLEKYDDYFGPEAAAFCISSQFSCRAS